MTDNVVPSGATNIGAKDVGSVLYEKILPWDTEYDQAVGMTSYRQRMTAMPYTVLADSMADGLAGFWTQTNANGGAVTVTGGEAVLSTSTATNGSAQLLGNAPPYFPGQDNWFHTAFHPGDTGVAGCIRRWGAFTVSGTTPQDGFAYELNGTTLNYVVFKAGVATTVGSTLGSNVANTSVTLDTNIRLWSIYWTANQAWFFQGGKLLHVTPVSATPITTTLNLPKCFQIIKTSGATNLVMGVRNAGLGRYGLPPQDSDQDAYYRGRGASFRMPGRAGTAARRLLALWNAAGSGRTVTLNQITLDAFSTAAYAVTVLPPIIRVHRITAIPTNGTSITKVAKDNAGVSSASVSLFQDASADGTNSTTALAATPVGTHLTQEFMPRLITAAGYEMSDRIELLVGQNVLVRPGEGVVLSYDNITAATQEPATSHTICTVDWTETA